MNEEWSKPKTTTTETRNFFEEVFEVMLKVQPYSAGQSPSTWGHGVTQTEMAAAWDQLVEGGRKISDKLSGILLDTGDVSARRFDRIWFGGSGEYSSLTEQILLDRVRYGIMDLGGHQQGQNNPDEIREHEELIRGIIQDVAVALTGEEIIFPEKEPEPPSEYDCDFCCDTGYEDPRGLRRCTKGCPAK